jgi:hypothetical protein
MAGRETNFHKQIPIQSFDPETGACSLEGKDGRATTCPNNPHRNSNQHLPDICVDCPIYPHVAPSTKKELPSIYADLKRERHGRKPTS